MDPRASLNALEKRKIFAAAGNCVSVFCLEPCQCTVQGNSYTLEKFSGRNLDTKKLLTFSVCLLSVRKRYYLLYNAAATQYRAWQVSGTLI